VKNIRCLGTTATSLQEIEAKSEINQFHLLVYKYAKSQKVIKIRKDTRTAYITFFICKTQWRRK
jgi:hypothetical protein